jgi:hypothetical protein
VEAMSDPRIEAVAAAIDKKTRLVRGMSRVLAELAVAADDAWLAAHREEALERLGVTLDFEGNPAWRVRPVTGGEQQ